jgi:hypothetical protein
MFLVFPHGICGHFLEWTALEQENSQVFENYWGMKYSVTFIFREFQIQYHSYLEEGLFRSNGKLFGHTPNLQHII